MAMILNVGLSADGGFNVHLPVATTTAIALWVLYKPSVVALVGGWTTEMITCMHGFDPVIIGVLTRSNDCRKQLIQQEDTMMFGIVQSGNGW